MIVHSYGNQENEQTDPKPQVESSNQKNGMIEQLNNIPTNTLAESLFKDIQWDCQHCKDSVWLIYALSIVDCSSKPLFHGL